MVLAHLIELSFSVCVELGKQTKTELKQNTESGRQRSGGGGGRKC